MVTYFYSRGSSGVRQVELRILPPLPVKAGLKFGFFIFIKLRVRFVEHYAEVARAYARS